MEAWQLKQMQNLPLEVKIEKTKLRIKEWYEAWDSKVHIAFSGGKDSTVLLHLVRELYPNVSAMYVDTGLEYPEIRDFVKTIENVDWIRPKMNFKEVIRKYGYPIISKEVASAISEIRNTNSEYLLNKRLNGDKNGYGKLPLKWRFLLEAPFEISSRCCSVMKKSPAHIYENKLKTKPYIGTMTEESNIRTIYYLKYGCNAFDKTHPSSQPISFWTQQDILKYIKYNNLKYANIYGKIIENDGEFYLTGVDRTGCMFCMFGCQNDSEPNRFQKMKLTHPKIYEYCMKDWSEGGLGIKKVLEYIKVKTK